MCHLKLHYSRLLKTEYFRNYYVHDVKTLFNYLKIILHGRLNKLLVFQ